MSNISTVFALNMLLMIVSWALMIVFNENDKLYNIFSRTTIICFYIFGLCVIIKIICLLTTTF